MNYFGGFEAQDKDASFPASQNDLGREPAPDAAGEVFSFLKLKELGDDDGSLFLYCESCDAVIEGHKDDLPNIVFLKQVISDNRTVKPV